MEKLARISEIYGLQINIKKRNTWLSVKKISSQNTTSYIQNMQIEDIMVEKFAKMDRT